jgi:hypothetical protein
MTTDDNLFQTLADKLRATEGLTEQERELLEAILDVAAEISEGTGSEEDVIDVEFAKSFSADKAALLLEYRNVPRPLSLSTKGIWRGSGAHGAIIIKAPPHDIDDDNVDPDNDNDNDNDDNDTQS